MKLCVPRWRIYKGVCVEKNSLVYGHHVKEDNKDDRKVERKIK